MILTYEMFAVSLSSILCSGFKWFGWVWRRIVAGHRFDTYCWCKAVIPLISVFAACNNLSRVFIYRKEIVWRTAIGTLASLPGVYFGAKLLEWMSESLLLLILGLIPDFCYSTGKKIKKDRL